MKTILILSSALALGAGAAFAESHASGDPAAGESVFNKCGSCHVVQSPDGENIAGRGQAGPNLYGLAGSQAGSVEGYNYGDS
nr:cytochrome C [Xanthomonadales bacterium]NIX13079.1 cytochrome C [Xanthomonadales bacterium]